MYIRKWYILSNYSFGEMRSVDVKKQKSLRVTPHDALRRHWDDVELSRCIVLHINKDDVSHGVVKRNVTSSNLYVQIIAARAARRGATTKRPCGIGLKGPIHYVVATTFTVLHLAAGCSAG